MSIEDLQKDKIAAEIEFLRAQTKDLEKIPEPENEKWDTKIKKWASVILSVVSLGAAIWGLLIPINNYVEERRAMLKFELNSQMVELVSELDSEEPADADRAILLLSYYEKNSLPILFYKVERASYFENPNLVTNIIQVISNVYEKHREEVKEILVDNLEAQIQKLQLNEQIDHYNLYAIYNLFLIIEQLPHNEIYRKDFLNIVNEKEKELKTLDPDGSKLSIIFTKINECKLKLMNEES